MLTIHSIPRSPLHASIRRAAFHGRYACSGWTIADVVGRNRRLFGGRIGRLGFQTVDRSRTGCDSYFGVERRSEMKIDNQIYTCQCCANVYFKFDVDKR